jgi:hypothetical protein
VDYGVLKMTWEVFLCQEIEIERVHTVDLKKTVRWRNIYDVNFKTESHSRLKAYSI